MVFVTKRRDTGQICEIRIVEKCCKTCQHFGFAPDGCGDCGALVDVMNGVEEGSPTVGASNVCDCWEQRTSDYLYDSES